MKKTVIVYLLLYMQIQLILYLQSTYPETGSLQSRVDPASELRGGDFTNIW